MQRVKVVVFSVPCLNPMVYVPGHLSGLPIIKMHVIKWKDEDLPYPDQQPPFHFAPEAYSQGKTLVRLKSANKKHDSYSMAIITWLLFIGKFIRPPFALNDNEAVKKYVMENTHEIGHVLLQMIYDLDDVHLKQNKNCMALIKDILDKFITSNETRYDIQSLHGILNDFIEKIQIESSV
jgi:hypothetical protein